jgi:hypothetical protein
MISKRFHITIALLVFTAMASTVSAGQAVARRAEPAKFSRRIDLRLSFGPVTLVGDYPDRSRGHWTTELQVRNSTDETIRRGTAIYWSVYDHIGTPTPASTVEIRGSFILERELAPGDVVRKGVALKPAGTRPVQPKLTPKAAWCILRADPKPPPLPIQQNPPARPNVTKPKEVVYLTAGMIGADLVIGNNTGSPIPQGTTIYWSVKGKCSPEPTASQCEKKGSFDGGLGNTGQKWISVYGVYPLYVAKGWFYK